MVFSDLFFLFAFLPAFAGCYLLATLADKRQKSAYSGKTSGFTFRNLMLAFFSLVFYAWGEPVYVFLMIVSVMINYVAGRRIALSRGAKRRVALAAGLVCNLVILANFKYLGFFSGILADVGLKVSVPDIALPIGISFYTFQSISYLVDVYRRESPVQRRFINLMLYISMFPQLIAGPIVRYGTVALEITSRRVSSADFAAGAYRFFIGLGKKVILANQLSEVSSQLLGSGLGELTTAGAWVGIVAFTLQIYFDFSGYSDMAIGLGRCLGFHFAENFRHPYCCTTITDFWRRWHISLGSFFRDYVYIPMGGNRRHQGFNILVVWFLTGMWHGASWNFIIWGVYFGLIVMIEKYTLLRVQHRLPRPLLHLYSMLLVVAGWGIFYFDNFESMLTFFSAFFFGAADMTDFVAEAAVLNNFWLWVVAMLFCMPVRSVASRALAVCCRGHAVLHHTVAFAVRTVVSLVMLVCSVALLVGATNNAFIYTRF